MWKCDKCGQEIDDNFDKCWKCAPQEPPAEPSDSEKAEELANVPPAWFKEWSEQQQATARDASRDASEAIRTRVKCDELYDKVGRAGCVTQLVAILGTPFAVIAIAQSLTGRSDPALLGVIGGLVGVYIGWVMLRAHEAKDEMLVDIHKKLMTKKRKEG